MFDKLNFKFFNHHEIHATIFKIFTLSAHNLQDHAKFKW